MKAAFTAEAYAKVNPTFNAAYNRWEMPDGRCERMQCLFPSEADALQFKRVSLANLASREKWEIDYAAAQAKAEAERNAYLASFQGFLSSDPMKAVRQLQVLERKFMFRGAAQTRKQIVETMVQEGRTLTDDGLETRDGYFAPLNKTERAYATHLIALRETTAV